MKIEIFEYLSHVAWQYALKSKRCSRETVEARSILAAIHINSGQVAVGNFIESLGYTLNDLHKIFLAADDQSKTNSTTQKKTQGKKSDTNKDSQYYCAGGFD